MPGYDARIRIIRADGSTESLKWDPDHEAGRGGCDWKDAVCQIAEDFDKPDVAKVEIIAMTGSYPLCVPTQRDWPVPADLAFPLDVFAMVAAWEAEALARIAAREAAPQTAKAA